MLEKTWPWPDPALEPARPGLRAHRHPPNRLHLWALDQHQVWVDLYGNEHEIESMRLDDVESALARLLEHACFMHTLRVCDLYLEAIERSLEGDNSGTARLEEAEHLEELDPVEWLEGSSLVRALSIRRADFSIVGTQRSMFLRVAAGNSSSSGHEEPKTFKGGIDMHIDVTRTNDPRFVGGPLVVGEPTGRPRPDDRLIGRVSHRLVQNLLASENRNPTAGEILAAAAEVTDTTFPPAQRAIIRTRCAMAAAGYFRRLIPDGRWTYAGSEMAVGEVRLDLLWRDRDGLLVADELKCGRLLAPLYRAEAIAQAARQAPAGRECWGSAFRGVRLLWVHAPEVSRFVYPDGTSVALKEVWR
jgi:hypothetical protein